MIKLQMPNLLLRPLFRLYFKMVREPAPPEFIARGWAIGMFFGCLIPVGMQLLFSLPSAFLLKGSKIGAMLGTLLTNHFTILIIYPLQCFAGARLLGYEFSYAEIRLAMRQVVTGDWQAFQGLGGDLVAAFFTGALLLALITTPLTYYGILYLVRKSRRRREHRARRRQLLAAIRQTERPPAP